MRIKIRKYEQLSRSALRIIYWIEYSDTLISNITIWNRDWWKLERKIYYIFDYLNVFKNI